LDGGQPDRLYQRVDIADRLSRHKEIRIVPCPCGHEGLLIEVDQVMELVAERRSEQRTCVGTTDLARRVSRAPDSGYVRLRGRLRWPRKRE
jgi:hypothetical protein